MKRIFMGPVALLLLTAAQPVQAGDKDMVTVSRKTANFERIKLLGSPDIKYTQGNTLSVRVKAPRNVVNKVLTRVENNQLIVSMENIAPKGRLGDWLNFSMVSGDDVTVYVTSPDLTGVEVHGSGEFECQRLLDTDNLNLVLKGSGDIEFADIICDRLKVTVVGSGDLEVKHLVTQQTDVDLVGSGDVKIAQEKVARTKISLKGSGDIKMSMKNCGAVNSTLIGSGDIELRGDVRSLAHSEKGSGDLNTKGLTVKKK